MIHLFSMKLLPWHMAMYRRQVMAAALAPAVFTQVFFETWADVYQPK